jgi:hypothetical protein
VLLSNAVWILQKLGKRDTRLFGVVLGLRALAFLIFRLPSLSFPLIYTYMCQKGLSKKDALKSIWIKIKRYFGRIVIIRLNRVVVVLTVLNMLALGSLNVEWTRMTVDAVLRWRASKTLKVGRVHHI